MPLLTPQLLQRLREIVERHHAAFVVNAFGKSTVAPEVLKELEAAGLVSKEPGQALRDAYLYGHVMAAVENPAMAGWPEAQFQKWLARNPVVLSPVEEAAVTAANLRAATYCVGLGNTVAKDTGQLLIEADAALRGKLMGAIKDATIRNVITRQSVGQLKSALGWAMDDWSRDLDRIAVTEKHNALTQGEADAIERKAGPEARCFFRPAAGACSACIKLHIGPDGHPRIFRLSQLAPAGANVKQRQENWVASKGSVHPHCACRLSRIPDGWGFNAEGQQVPGGEFGVEVGEEGLQKAMAAEDAHQEALRKALSGIPEGKLEKARKLAGRMDFQGLQVSLEHQAGDTRHWYDPHAKEAGTTTMKVPYGYVRGTEGVDGDHHDVFMGPDPNARFAYVVHARKKVGVDKFGGLDEQKTMLGFSSAAAARAAYLSHYNAAGFYGGMDAVPMDEFKRQVLGTRHGKTIHGQPVEFPEHADGPRLVLPLEKSLDGREWPAEPPRAAPGPLGDPDVFLTFGPPPDAFEKAFGAQVGTHKYIHREYAHGHWVYEYAKVQGGHLSPHPTDPDKVLINIPAHQSARGILADGTVGQKHVLESLAGKYGVSRDGLTHGHMVSLPITHTQADAIHMMEAKRPIPATMAPPPVTAEQKVERGQLSMFDLPPAPKPEAPVVVPPAAVTVQVAPTAVIPPGMEATPAVAPVVQEPGWDRMPDRARQLGEEAARAASAPGGKPKAAAQHPELMAMIAGGAKAMPILDAYNAGYQAEANRVADATLAAPSTAAAAPAAPIVARSKDFAETGNYTVTFPDGYVAQIFRDPESKFWFRVMPSASADRGLLGATRAEALEALQVFRAQENAKQAPQSASVPDTAPAAEPVAAINTDVPESEAGWERMPDAVPGAVRKERVLDPGNIERAVDAAKHRVDLKKKWPYQTQHNYGVEWAAKTFANKPVLDKNFQETARVLGAHSSNSVLERSKFFIDDHHPHLPADEFASWLPRLAHQKAGVPQDKSFAPSAAAHSWDSLLNAAPFWAGVRSFGEALKPTQAPIERKYETLENRKELDQLAAKHRLANLSSPAAPPPKDIHQDETPSQSGWNRMPPGRITSNDQLDPDKQYVAWTKIEAGTAGNQSNRWTSSNRPSSGSHWQNFSGTSKRISTQPVAHGDEGIFPVGYDPNTDTYAATPAPATAPVAPPVPEIPETPKAMQKDPKATAAENRQRAREAGEHIGASRKDAADLRALVEGGQLDKVSYADAARFLKKESLMPVLDAVHYQQEGASPGAAHMAITLASLVGSKPPDSDEYRKAYVEGVRMVAGGIQKIKTTADAATLIDEIQKSVNNAGIHTRRAEDHEVEGIALGTDATHGGEHPVWDFTARNKLREKLEAKYSLPAHSMTVMPPPNGQGMPLISTTSREERDNVFRMMRALGPRFIAGLNLKVPKEGEREGPWGFRSKFRYSGDTATGRALQVAKAADVAGWDAYLEKNEDKDSAPRERKTPDEKQVKWKQSISELPEVAGTLVQVAKGDPARFKDKFGFTGVQPGQNLPDDEYEYHVRHAEMAFTDLAGVLGLAPDQVSMNGRLGVRFASTGTGKAAAHYEPSMKAINITRFKGAGTLAHEWGHFLDNVTAEIHGGSNTASRGAFASEGAGNMPPELKAAFTGLRRAMTGGDTVKALADMKARLAVLRGKCDELNKQIATSFKTDKTPTGEAERLALTKTFEKFQKEHNTLRKFQPTGSMYSAHAAALDGYKSGGYWSEGTEMFARAFEAYVQDKIEDTGTRRNSYLVDGTRKPYEVGTIGPDGNVAQRYPQGEERKRINAAFDVLFQAMHNGGHFKKALEFLDGMVPTVPFDGAGDGPAEGMEKGGTVYTGPRGGQYSNPEHTKSWTPAQKHVSALADNATILPGDALPTHEDHARAARLHLDAEKQHIKDKNPEQAAWHAAQAVEHRHTAEHMDHGERTPAHIKNARVGTGKVLDTIAATPGPGDKPLRKGGPGSGIKGHTTADHPEVHVSLHPAIHGRPGEGPRPMVFHQTDLEGDRVRLSPDHDVKHQFGPVMHKDSVKHFRNDLAGVVDLPPSGNPDIDAVTSGKAAFLGKGDDGMAFKVGDKVVKVSTTVPFQPENQGHRTPQEAADMLRAQVETGNKLADAGVPHIQRSEFIQHGDKGFQVKPWVAIPEKLDLGQLNQVRDAVMAMHARGITLNDQPQAGIDANGKVVLFDIGKAAPDRGKTWDGKDAKATGRPSNDVEGDLSRLRDLFHENGHTLPRAPSQDWDDGMEKSVTLPATPIPAWQGAVINEADGNVTTGSGINLQADGGPDHHRPIPPTGFAEEMRDWLLSGSPRTSTISRDPHVYETGARQRLVVPIDLDQGVMATAKDPPEDTLMNQSAVQRLTWQNTLVPRNYGNPGWAGVGSRYLADEGPRPVVQVGPMPEKPEDAERDLEPRVVVTMDVDGHAVTTEQDLE